MFKSISNYMKKILIAAFVLSMITSTIPNIAYAEVQAPASFIKVRYRLDLRAYTQANISNSTAVEIYSPFSNIISQNMPAWSEASDWATPELKKADSMGLIPDVLKGADLTKPITRKEFAAVSVKLYEKLSGKAATPVAKNPFTDTDDIEVLKAYNVGVTDGVSADKFDPDTKLNREQAATMLTRVFKKTFVEGWSLKEDSKFKFNYTMLPKFADDAKISEWAKPSVYFMVSHGIIKGIDSKNFAPKATTSAEQAANYASATREQSIIIAVRMAENLDKDDAKEIIPPVQDTSNASSIVGTWILGTLSGDELNTKSGKYEGGASGIGNLYIFYSDGSYKALWIWSDVEYATGKYTVSDGVITLKDIVGEKSTDGGKTWTKGDAASEASVYYTIKEDTDGKYLILGQIDSTPPLVEGKNALKYRLKK